MQKLDMVFPTLPNSKHVRSESFAVRSGVVNGRTCLVIAVTELRTTLYGVGWILGAMTYESDALVVPMVDAKEQPALVSQSTLEKLVGLIQMSSRKRSCGPQ